jgi:hypothetical protein
MSMKQIKTALDRVCVDWKTDDLIYAFDRCSAEQIEFEELVEYSLEIQEPYDLRLSLFKRGSYMKWVGSGSAKAAILAPNHTIKVCLTDGLIPNEDFKGFNRIVRIL